MIHPTALVESKLVGESTNIWAYAHVMPGAEIGCNVNIGDHAYVEGGARIGDNVTLKNHVCVWDGITIEDDVFVGPNVTFTNDKRPRSPRMEQARPRYARRETWLASTVVRRGCSIGAAAVILPGIELGAFCMIGAGAVVTKDVSPFALVCGTPARKIGEVCRCGRTLSAPLDAATCHACGETPQQRMDAWASASHVRSTPESL